MARLRYMTGTTLLAASFTAAASTANITQTDVSASNFVPIGALINQCVVPGTVALTFDDGPFSYTSDLLEILSAYGAPATFFLNGHCLGDVYYNSDIVQRIVNEGHQLGSHTWSHLPLPSLDYNTIVGQMRELEDAFEEVVGAVPTYMRPPFLAVDGKVLSAMANLGYHVIGASIDTKDYENNSPDLISRSFEKFRAELNAGGTIVLSHDVHEQTVYSLTRMMLEEIFARGLQPVTVGDCLGDPQENWYR